ncbi:ACP S-malonyltransferase [Fimbriimonas ginsengisoli]|uniref:Malonyl CoA-acyl carrier protein transacylase n=1 Tax=Fimbriimonas ginsengisoli Gsoil 348 TaxID=661478 RepID=A0A068NMS3_FIMGI|nr:ACP S-malonyltransferase [Fimbriimonas ginsengisoli]AIE84868.1 malonyl CoA-acyl carrier protein transacylase [Fimbriimonas ginsengisoli Gsoil 348]
MIAIVFPGQGSQKPGMGKELVEASPEARDVFRRVSDAVGFDVEKLCFESDEETLRQTQNAQIALFACGVAAYRALEARLPDQRVGAMAGHSIGEYPALVAAGVFTLEEGARLVRTRGDLMARSGQERPGTMAAVLGLERDLLEEACREVEGIAVIANDNCPGQLVISGEVEAVRLAGLAAQAKGAKRVLPLNVSGAFHSPLMEVPAREMGVALRQATVSPATAKVYSNVTSEAVEDVASIPALLERQLSSPVRWTESVQHMIRDGVDTFIECGTGEVLCGLIRRTDKSVRTMAVQDLASLEAVATGG